VESLTDNELMARVRAGETEKLGVLFERHHRLLFSFLVRLTNDRELSEDTVQDTFLRMLKYRHTFRPDKAFRSWMFQIARNVIHGRAQARRNEHSGIDPDLMETLECPQPTPDSQLNLSVETRLLEDALARLSPEKREVLLLSRIRELRGREVAEILGCNEATVRVRLHRALTELKEVFHRLTGVKRYEV
jgi:RNA polymerase sigma-70 factor (ECF subfamily)